MVAISLLSWPFSVHHVSNFPIFSPRESESCVAKQIAEREKKLVSPSFISPVFRSDSCQASSLHPNYILETTCPQTLSPPGLLFSCNFFFFKLRVDRGGNGGGEVVTGPISKLLNTAQLYKVILIYKWSI